MRRLRSKFISVFVLLTLLPAVVVAWLANNLLQKALAIGLQPQTAQGLNFALETVQQLTQLERAALSRDLHQLAAALPKEKTTAVPSPDPAHRIALYDRHGNLLRHWSAQAGRQDLPRPPAPPVLQDSLNDAGSDSLAIRLALTLEQGVMLVGERRVPDALRRQTLTVLRAAQFTTSLTLKKRLCNAA